MSDFLYYIFKDGVDSDSLKVSDLPQIRKIIKVLGNTYPLMNDEKQAEGPYDSIYNLKKKSLIFNNIKLQKHKERVLSNKNIKEIIEFVKIPFEEQYELTFIKAFHHINVGKIIKHKVTGVHFYNPDRIKILEIVSKNNLTGVYIAKISKYDLKSDSYIEKKELTNFFPDDWDLAKLFKELNYAYNHKHHFEGRIYMSETSDKIPVKLIIDEGEILTIYPMIE